MRFNEQSRRELDPGNREGLETYVEKGLITDDTGRPAIDVDPPRQRWERFLPSYLAAHATSLRSDFEERSLNDSTWANADAAAAFAASYTAQMIELRTHALFPRRFNGRALRNFSIKGVPFAALGLVVGAEVEAIRLAKMQISAYRRDYYFDGGSYPIFFFMLRLLADFLGTGGLEPREENADRPALNALCEIWRGPADKKFVELCLAACDFHTWRCRPATGSDSYHEFDDGSWMRTPIELLLLLKLREKIGAQTPVLDHPLMNTSLGALPAEVGFRPDDLTARVRARMQKDNHDEDEIVRLLTP